MEQKRKLTLGGLFEGIGGFPLAATWAGIKPIWSNEIDSFCCKVLRKNFDHEIIEKDIREIGKHNLKSVDIITGGFPCQPFSQAGKRKGTKDDRYLWPEMLRIIKELKPSYVIGENVAGLISMENGGTLEGILTDLEDEGYRTETFTIPACAIGAWHRRDRIWIIAYSNSIGKSTRLKQVQGENEKISKWNDNAKSNDTDKFNASNPNSKRLSGTTCTRKQSIQSQAKSFQGGEFSRTNAKGWEYWEVEPNVDRMVARVSGRVDRLKGLGNAIVPQVAVELFKVIKEYEKLIN